MRLTTSLFSKANRRPLTSKKGNKDFYKGTGSYPRLGFKRTGVHYGLSKGSYKMVPERMRYFAVPPGLHEETELKPYVEKGVKRPGISNARDIWPVAETKEAKFKDKNFGGVFSKNGFDGHYYLQLLGYTSPAKQQ